MRLNTMAPHAPPRLDPFLLIVSLSLLAIGLVMVTSASIGIAEARHRTPLYFGIQQTLSLCVGIPLGWLAATLPMQFWRRVAVPFLALCVGLLILLFVPGIGREVNGSVRWLNLGFFSFQVSELTKLALILYLAHYLVKFNAQVRTGILSSIKLFVVLGFIALLLLMEPDFGTTVVMMATAMGMLFIGGVPVTFFIGLLGVVGSVLAWLAISAPYRLKRLTSFLDPWADQFNSGYQLTQSLIAIGRGEITGVGLGSSVQKLLYLPEAHTDFIFAIIAEEWGLLGASFVVALLACVVIRAFNIGLVANKRHDHFAALFCFGLGLLIGLQAIISIGVNTGLLPTKGLTLPFISYGRTSIVVLMLALGLLFRVDYENRLAPVSVRKKG